MEPELDTTTALVPNSATCSEFLPLTELAPALAASTDREVPTYHKLWQNVVNGRIVARKINGRYHVRRADLVAIAATLGLTPSEDHPAPAGKAAADRMIAA